MNKIIEHRIKLEATQPKAKEFFEYEDYNYKNFEFIVKNDKEMKYKENPLQYFPGSIIEEVSETGKIYNDLRIFSETMGEPDLKLDKESYFNELKNFKYQINPEVVGETQTGEPKYHFGPKLLFCITMYQEEWSQILQTMAGCIRSICELHQERLNYGNIGYDGEAFGIVLICDGIDKLPKPFVEKMIDYELFDPAMCCHTVCKRENKKHIKKTFAKDRAPISTDRIMK